MIEPNRLKAHFSMLSNPQPCALFERFPEIDTSKFFEPLPESELVLWEGKI